MVAAAKAPPSFDFNWELAVVKRCRALNETDLLERLDERCWAYENAGIPGLPADLELALDSEALRRQRLYREHVRPAQA